MEPLTVGKWTFSGAPPIPRTTPTSLWVDEELSAAASPPLRPYTARMVEALDTLDLDGKIVLDLGCADGILSLVAARKGAARVWGIDKDPRMSRAYWETMRRNAIPRDQYRFLLDDIEKTKGLLARLPPQADVVLANLGPHYGHADLAAITILSEVRAKVFVGGGYTKDGPAYHPRRAMSALAMEGFTRGHREFVAPLDEDLPRMAFIVQRS